MFKTIIKETFIMLLLCVAIVLIFGIVFYEYIPVNKVVPKKVAYSVSEEVKAELESDVSVEESQPLNIIYSVDAVDLQKYEESGSYVPGKPNPFEPFTSTNNNTFIENNNISQGNSIEEYYPTNSSTK